MDPLSTASVDPIRQEPLESQAISPAISPQKASDETDTCRICRGEGSPEEPLFFPCKCSGSIKYVHQECLMEWLSHSQKKHCELCKTSFRFTKLYDSTMPKHLPFLLFIRKAAVHLFHALLTWLRAILVAAVWLFWLPWSMRFVWWGLFWIGDGSWTSDFHHIRSALDSDSPLRPLVTPISSSSPPSSTQLGFSGALTSNYYFPKLPWLLNIKYLLSNSTSAMGSLATSVYSSIIHRSTQPLARNATLQASPSTTATNPMSNDTSLLSYISFFHNLTPNPAFNKFIVDILEGQIITLAVVTAFILVFLIREWVVQQQPALHLGLIADDDVNPGVLLAAHGNQNGPQNDEQQQQQRQHHQPQHDEFPDRNESDQDRGVEPDATNQSLQEEPSPGLRNSTLNFLDENEANVQTESSHNIGPRPSMPMRSQSSLATNIQRDLQETATSSNTDIGSLGADEAIVSRARVDQQTQPPSDIPQPVDVTTASTSSIDDQRFHAESSTTREFRSFDTQDSPQSSRPFGEDILDSTEQRQQLDQLDQLNSAHPGSSLGAGQVLVDLNFPSPQQADNSIPVEDESTPDLSPAAAVESSSDDFSPEYANITDESVERDAVDNPQEQQLQQQPQPDAEDTTNEPAEQDIEEMPHQQPSIYQRTLNWMFADVARDVPQDREQTENEERVVNDVAEEAPFVPFAEARPRNRGDRRNPEDNDQQAAAAGAMVAQIGNNNLPNEAEPQEEVEDLEGVLELIGMQGPLASLFQNAVFCAVLISATVTSAVWFPYLCGKMVLIFLAHPIQWSFKAPLQLVSGGANFAIDLCLFVCFKAMSGLDHLFRACLSTVSWMVPGLTNRASLLNLHSTFVHVADSALHRMVATIASLGIGQGASTPHLSLSSLTALRLVQSRTRTVLSSLATLSQQGYDVVDAFASKATSLSEPSTIVHFVRPAVIRSAAYLQEAFENFVHLIRAGEWSMNINLSLPSGELASKLEDWTPTDRLTTVTLGYTFFAIMGGLYLHRGAPFSTSQQGRKVERVITEILQQSGGVLKVILIISIEMILFPLYCGLLLDAAMLPLFQTTIDSRIESTAKAPWTSSFIHWFLGTCYMFHFALFVSMCRKIFRSGVLYFIRDPDDPTFHPVRDVLERTVSSQLRKIGFSALVYGALVMVCMGSVIWGVALSFDSIFPLSWKSESPLLGFPVDILLYNLLAPLAIQFFRPAKGLRNLYKWWFKFCAKKLRLTNFLFEQSDDEAARESEQSQEPQYGRYVRAPASDQVRIPKGHSVFLDVDKDNRRRDGKEDTDDGPHGKSNPHYTQVWIPPWYRTRIAIFVFFVWALTAFVGVSVTILPLLLGRTILALLFQGEQRLNDVYAFSIGGSIFVALAYGAYRLRRSIKFARMQAALSAYTVSRLPDSLNAIGGRLFKVLYTYSALCVYVPALIALLIESYFIMPLHTYLSLGQTSDTTKSQLADPSTAHTMSFLQDCTLGLLYLRVFLRLLLWNPNSRPARALHAIVSAGWLNPNAKIATKCFILPITVFTLLALIIPPGLGLAAYNALPFTLTRLQQIQTIDSLFPNLISRLLKLDARAQMVYMIRFSYPALLSTIFNAWILWLLAKAAGRWKSRIKDEVYLIGERLHNFGERRPPQISTTAAIVEAQE